MFTCEQSTSMACEAAISHSSLTSMAVGLASITCMGEWRIFQSSGTFLACTSEASPPARRYASAAFFSIARPGVSCAATRGGGRAGCERARGGCGSGKREAVVAVVGGGGGRTEAPPHLGAPREARPPLPRIAPEHRAGVTAAAAVLVRRRRLALALARLLALALARLLAFALLFLVALLLLAPRAGQLHAGLNQLAKLPVRLHQRRKARRGQGLRLVEATGIHGDLQRRAHVLQHLGHPVQVLASALDELRAALQHLLVPLLRLLALLALLALLIRLGRGEASRGEVQRGDWVLTPPGVPPPRPPPPPSPPPRRLR